MAAKNNNPKYVSEAEELISILSSVATHSKAIDDSTKRAEALMKNLSGFADTINRTLESSMTFATREMNKSFGQYTRSFAKAQGEAAMRLNDEKVHVKETLDSLNDAIEDLDSAAKASGKAVDETVKNALIQKRDQAQLHLNNLNNIKSEQAFKIQTINELRKFSINVVTSMANSIVKIYQDAMANAYNKFSSTWENTYGTNTSYNAYNKSDYNAVIDSLQQFIKEKGLTNTVSINDYQEEISNILKGGLTGPLATTVAKYSVLSKEGGISADFADPAFLKTVRQIEKDGGNVERFLSNIMTQSKGVITEVGDAMGFANGEINTMVNSIHQLSTVAKMSDEAMENTTTSMTALAGVLGSTDFDANKLFTDITEYAKSGLTVANKSSLLSFADLGTSADVQKIISEQGTEAVIKEAMKGIYEQYGSAISKGGKSEGEFLTKLNEALGGSHTNEELQSLFRNFGSYKDFEKDFEKAMTAANKTTEQQYFDKLEDYQTEQEKLNNTAENQLSELGQLAKHSVIIETLIGGVITAITTTAMFGKNGLINSGNLNKLRSLFGGGGGTLNNAKAATDLFKSGASFKDVAGVGGTGTAALGKVGQLFSNGTAFASKGGTLAKVGSKVFSTGGKALGVAGSLISMGLDAYNGYKEDGAAGAFRGAITGSGKAAGSGWDVAKGAGSGALKGAGIGMVFGPWGAAIGAAVGGLAGLAVGLRDLNDVSVQSKQALKSTNEALIKLAENSEDVKKAQERLVSVTELVEQASSGQKDAQKKLIAQYPGYASQLQGLDTSSEEYKNILDQIIKLETKRLLDEQGSGYSTAIGKTSAKTVSSQSSANIKSLKNSVVGAEVDNATVSNQTLHDEKDALNREWSAGTIAGNGLEIKAGAGMTESAKIISWDSIETALLNAGISQESIDHMDNKAKVGAAAKLGLINVNGIDKYVNYFDENYSAGLGQDVINQIRTNYDMIKDFTPNLANYTRGQIYKSWNDFTAGTKLTSAQIDTLMSYYNYLYDMSKSAPEQFEQATTFDSFESWKETFPKLDDGSIVTPKVFWDSYKDAAKFNSKYTPAFAVGLNYVPYDNFYARLHKGEKIVTAADATLERASVKGNSMIPALQNALVSQTDIIIGILEKIYSNLSGKPSGLTGEFSSSVPSIASTI